MLVVTDEVIQLCDDKDSLLVAWPIDHVER